MEITYLGHSSFNIKGKTATLVTDPFDSSVVGLKFPTVEADIVTVSHQHQDHNNTNGVRSVKRVINGPGEYEISGISIIGLSSYHDDKKGKLRGKNTIYVIETDGFRIAHLGDLGHTLSEKTLDAMGDIDVLLVPVGGEYTINAQVAAGIARDIEADITIPMHYQTKGLDAKTFSRLADEKPFLNDLGLPVENLPKLSIKKELLGEDKKIVILNVK